MLMPLKNPIASAFAAVLITACGGASKPSESSSAEHEDLRTAVDAVHTDTKATKSNTEFLKTDFATVKADTATVKADTSALKSDLTALRNSVGTNLNTQLSEVQSSLGTPPSGNSLYATFMAARRYSRTCNPATDSWLRSAWPGLSDTEITDACRRDGRWHYLGTMLNLITGDISLPDEMQVGLSSYTKSITPVSVNSWNRGIRLCMPPIGVGDVHIVNGSSLVHECITFMDGKFTVTHKLVDQTTTEYSQRDYRTYTAGDDSTLPCTESGGLGSCSLSESNASYWPIYIRQ